MNLKIKLIFTLLFLFKISVYSQEESDSFEVKGVVVSSNDNTPLPSVNVIVVKAKKGTTTDFDGNYKIMVKKNDVLQFSFLGFVTKAVIVGDQKIINIALTEDSSQLDEIVVVGYGSLKKSNITSAISTFKNDKLAELPVARLDQALQGKLAGVNISNTSSAAGEPPVIRIRGQASINASADPLIVLDGQAIEDGLDAVNMDDVESVSVLKDASSAAIYGSRGANGVILITTKSGSENKTTYNFNNSIGFKSAYELYDIQSSSEYVERLYEEQALRFADPLWDTPGGVPNVSTNYQKRYILEQAIRGGESTSYQDEFMRTGIFRNTSLSASGGKKGLKYRISGAYSGDEAMMRKSSYDKYQLRVKLNADLTKKLKLNINIAPTYSERERPANDYRDYFRFPSFIPIVHTAETLAFAQSDGNHSELTVGDYANPQHFYSLLFPQFTLPDGTLYDNPSLTNPWSTSSINPLKVLDLQDDTEEEFRIQSSLDLIYQATSNLTFKTTASAYYRFSDRLQWVGTNARSEFNDNYAVNLRRNYRDFLSESTVNYIKDYKKHSFNALLGFSAQRTDLKTSSFTAQNFPNDNIRAWSSAASIVKANFNSSNDDGGEFRNARALLSYYGRLVYSFDSTYNLTATIRRDGASQFGPGNKWGTFSSVSAGVNFAKFNFLESSDVINKLNLRVAYGQVGNNRTDQLPGNNAFNPYISTLEGSNYVDGSNGVVNGQATLSAITDAQFNADLTWETTVSTNIGIDIGLFRNRINLSAEFYESNTDRLLLTPNNQLFTGAALAWNNVGSLQNRGHEIELSTTNIVTEDFRWTTSGNYASNRLELTDFGGLAETPQTGERGEQYISRVGSPLVQFFGYKTDGVWLSQAEIDASGFTASSYGHGTLVPGSLKIVDVTGDGVIDVDDRTIIGDPYADFTWGMTNTFEYKNFDMTFGFQGVHGIDMYLGDTGYNEARREVTNYNSNRWVSPSNPGDGQTPYETFGGVHWVTTDYGVDDASFVALREFTLGYNLEKDFIQKIGLKQLRLYFTGQNLLFLTKKDFRGLNAESRRSSGTYANPLIAGYDRGGYPVPKTIVLGINVKF
jgi:TonB-linked SusC/RagA family outer membrane protein